MPISTFAHDILKRNEINPDDLILVVFMRRHLYIQFFICGQVICVAFEFKMKPTMSQGHTFHEKSYSYTLHLHHQAHDEDTRLTRYGTSFTIKIEVLDLL